jgi:hypothetical protein
MTNTLTRRPLEWYWEHAPELTPKAISEGAKLHDRRGDFEPVYVTGLKYRGLKNLAAERRRDNIPWIGADAEDERPARQAFAEACKAFEDKHGRLF